MTNHILEEQYYQNVEELSKKIDGFIGQYLQAPHMVRCVSIRIEPITPVVGDKWEFHAAMSVQFRTEGYAKPH